MENKNIMSVAAGENHTAFLTETTLYRCGENRQGNAFCTKFNWEMGEDSPDVVEVVRAQTDNVALRFTSGEIFHFNVTGKILRVTDPAKNASIAFSQTQAVDGCFILKTDTSVYLTTVKKIIEVDKVACGTRHMLFSTKKGKVMMALCDDQETNLFSPDLRVLLKT
jgi:hypothetical protein